MARPSSLAAEAASASAGEALLVKTAAAIAAVVLAADPGIGHDSVEGSQIHVEGRQGTSGVADGLAGTQRAQQSPGKGAEERGTHGEDTPVVLLAVVAVALEEAEEARYHISTCDGPGRTARVTVTEDRRRTGLVGARLLVADVATEERRLVEEAVGLVLAAAAAAAHSAQGRNVRSSVVSRKAPVVEEVRGEGSLWPVAGLGEVAVPVP